ncbi:MAG: ATP-binding protein [Myxococcota bacterium]|nr:ATP-binding protein [Myxococcota bacterium]
MKRERELAYYILFRLVICLGLLVISVLSLFNNPDQLSASKPQFYFAAGVLSFMAISAGLAPKYANRPGFLWVQMIVDAVFVSALVSAEGFQSPLFVLYSINIIAAVRLLPAMGVLWVAILDAFSFICVGIYGFSTEMDWIQNQPDILIYTQFVFRIFGLLLVGFLSMNLAARHAETQQSLFAQVRRVQKLSQQHERLLKRLPIAMLLVDKGRIYFQNTQAFNFFGEVQHRLIIDIFPKIDERWEQNWQHEGGIWLLEVRCIDLDVERQVFLVEDVSQLREMESRSLREVRMAAVGRLAASLAHEIRNPLASLSGATQLLDQTEGSKLHAIILREVKRINELVEDFLRTSRPPELKRTFIHPERIVREVVESLSLDPRCNHLDVTMSLKEGEELVYLDEKLFRQIIWNLLLNAAHATTNGDTVQIDSNISEKMWVLTLRDTGAGIPSEQLSRIFDPFFTTRSGGTGLGLATVERIVHGHGGRVEVESEIDKGTVFYVKIPILRS